MRIALALPLFALAACQVTEDDTNDQMTVQYNQDVAENAAEDVANAAEEAGEAVINGAKDVGNAVENVDVDVDLNKADNDKATNSN
jgi:hypothetical protein